MSGTIILNLYEQKVQTDEIIRIDCTKTFMHPGGDTITSITIQPEAAGSTFTVTNDKFLDFAYSTTGSKTITVTLNHSSGSITKTDTITVVSESEEKLFSKDSDLIAHEPQILEYLPGYRSDYKYKHRLAQDRILAKLDEMGIHDNEGNKLTIADVTDVEEFRQLSKFMVLRMIFESLSNQVGDIFFEKSKRYSDFERDALNRVKIRMDLDNDGTADDKVRNLTRGLFRV